MSADRRSLLRGDLNVAKYEEMESNVPSFSYFYGTGTLFETRRQIRNYERLVIEESRSCFLSIVDCVGTLDARRSPTMSTFSPESES